MPRDDKNFKRQVRARMAKTGELYTVARADLEAERRTGSLLRLAREGPRAFPKLRLRSTTTHFETHDDEGQLLLLWDPEEEDRGCALQLIRGKTRITMQASQMDPDELIRLARTLRPVDPNGKEAEVVHQRPRA